MDCIGKDRYSSKTCSKGGFCKRWNSRSSFGYQRRKNRTSFSSSFQWIKKEKTSQWKVTYFNILILITRFSTLKALIVSKGSAFTVSLEKPEVDITAEMIASGAWKDKTFKKYNFEALGVPPSSGHLHPLLKVRSEFRDIFFQMGFTEMPTNRYVESSFWNFDALFQPQQHPARDAHDTFFLKGQ